MRPNRAPIALGLAVALSLTVAHPAHAQRLFGRRAEAAPLLREGKRLEEAGQYLDALDAYNKYLELRPRDIEALTRRGSVSLRLDQPERAIADFDLAIGRNPTYASPYNGRGEAQIMLGRYDAALRDFSAALALNGTLYVPGRVVAHCGIGQVYHRTGRDDLAILEYDRAIKLNPRDPNPYTGRADTLASIGRLDEAVADYGRALEIDPRFSRALGGRAMAYTELGQADRARADFDAALKLDPNYKRALSHRASFHAREGRPEQALADFDSVLKRHPNDPLARKSRAAVLIKLGEPGRALKDLDEAIRIDPKLASAYLNRGAAYNSLRKFDLALKDLDEAARLDPSNSAVYNNRGLAYWGLGRGEEAVRDFDEALRLDPSNVTAYLNRGGAFAYLRRPELALRDFDSAAAIDPRSVAARIGHDRASAAISQGAATRDADLSLRLDPRDPAEFCRRGNARRSRGDIDGALADFDAALKLDPGYAAAHAYRGWALLIADRDGAEADASVYLAAKGPREPDSIYSALLGHFAARRAGRFDEARRFLDEALVNAPPSAWPYPVLRYLDRAIDADRLLAAAKTDGERAEARVLIGLSLLQSGARRAALEHLRRARDLAAPGTLARDLALANLRRLESAGRP